MRHLITAALVLSLAGLRGRRGRWPHRGRLAGYDRHDEADRQAPGQEARPGQAEGTPAHPAPGARREDQAGYHDAPVQHGAGGRAPLHQPRRRECPSAHALRVGAGGGLCHLQRRDV